MAFDPASVTANLPTVLMAGGAVGAAAGAAVGLLLRRARDLQILKAAQSQYDEIVGEARSEADERLAEAKARVEEARESLLEAHADEIEALEARIAANEEAYRVRRSQADRDYNIDLNDIKRQASELDARFKGIQEAQQAFDSASSERAQLKRESISRLAERSGSNPENVRAEILAKLEDQARVDAKRSAAAYEDDARLHADEYAKRILAVALSRFPRKSCTERGIGTVEIPTDAARAKLMGVEGRIWKKLEGLADVDLTINDQNVIQIASYDPFKRELVTRCLEKLIGEKKLDDATVERIFEKTKRDLSNRIEDDGRKIAAELGQNDLNPEIKRMLGSLRYRYSFAQNQHFHVAEVGWLCGLLAQELGTVRPRDARRAGLLHDVGKAMDHSIEGGHAVIGADFIRERGESDHIVHAVRAHHFEEQPSSDLAFLVIAADAISGARPGARRSTVHAYNQKIEALSTIGDGFPGVSRTLVFNAGREVRILVDGARVSDQQSLVLARKIADKIEEECTYPGQIRVVLVRETHAEAFAK